LNRSRLFVILFLLLTAGNIALNWILWHFWVEDLLTGKYAGGDLSRLGYVYGSRMPRQKTVTLPFRHMEARDYDGRSIDVLTIGDSFSNADYVGENSCYQDYIATYGKNTVINLLPWYRSEEGGAAPIFTLLQVLNSGYLDRFRPKYLILQTVERSAIYRLARPLDFDIPASYKEVESFYRGEGLKFHVDSDYGFINTGNYKFILNNVIYYPIFGHDMGNGVYTRKLDGDYFSVKKSNQLVHCFEDINNVPMVTPEAVAYMNENLNRLADRLRAKGIRLVFLPIVDKTNLYGDHILENTYPRSHFFELLRPLSRRYQLIDTKEILTKELDRGVKDLYYADDTHWSWKASDAVFKQVQFPKQP
jgi:hypothetical protein